MIFKNLKNKLNISLFSIIFIFVIDRISKFYIIYLSQKNFDNELFISTYLNIILIWNDGIAFGLLSSKENYLYNLISLIIIIIILILFYLIYKSKKFKKFSYILVTGGALGNVFDRVFYKSVPDFIDVHFNGFHWFIFNIADIFITIGVICLIYDEIFIEKTEND